MTRNACGRRLGGSVATGSPACSAHLPALPRRRRSRWPHASATGRPHLRRRTRAATAQAARPRTRSSPAIDAADFAEHVKTLSSDAFEGRGPGTPGEDKSVEYIKAQLQRIGLKPGNNGDWFQTVPMVETTADPNTTLTLTVDGKPRTLKFGDDMVDRHAPAASPTIDIKDSPLVFVGYGVDAPEQHWNDYAGLDVKGKTVVMLVNDPGFHVNDAKLFEGKRMTYYGRWTYKYEEAARQGAAAALIIHDTRRRVLRLGRGEELLVRRAVRRCRPSDDPAPRLPAQGWLTGRAGEAPVRRQPALDLDELRKAANKRGFKAVPTRRRRCRSTSRARSSTSSRAT